jgi:parallel beta-helix repeat protein
MKKIINIMSLWLSLGCFVYGQALIDSSHITQTLYVNVNSDNASDTNPGTNINMPLKTIQHALNKAKNISSKIIVAPGEYRNYLDITSDSLIILEASEHYQSTISGSEVFSDWRVFDSLYSHPWPYDWGEWDDSEACFGPCQSTEYQKRRELLFINEKPVKQVVKTSNLKNNTFFVDEANDRILLNPPNEIDLSSVKIEVSTKGYDIYGTGRNGSLIRATIFNNSGLIIRGFRIQHVANTMHQDALTISNSGNVLIDKCIFQWNNGVGLELVDCENVTVQNCEVRYNGERGMGVGSGKNLLITDLSIYENNWRTNTSKIIAHDAAGIKLYGGIENCVLNNIHAYNNYCHTIWFDWNNSNYTIENSLIEHNQETGIMLEASRKPANVENCTLLYNDVGIKGYGHSNVRVDSCFLFANGSQISLGQDGRTVSQDGGWEISCNDWEIKNSKIISATPTQGMISFFEYFSPATHASSDYYNTATADSNIYYHPNGDKQWPDGQSVNGGQLTLDEWRDATDQDIHSTWQKPSPNEVGGNKPPQAILEYEYYNDTILRFFADKSSDPEDLINSYKWYFGDGNTSEKRNVNHFYSQQGNVTVSLVVTDFFGVKDSASVDIYIGPNDIKSVQEINSTGVIFPNPIKEQFFFKCDKNLNGNSAIVTIYNQAGQIITKNMFMPRTNIVGPVNSGILEQGIYYVNIAFDSGVVITRTIIKTRNK